MKYETADQWQMVKSGLSANEHYHLTTTGAKPSDGWLTADGWQRYRYRNGYQTAQL